MRVETERGTRGGLCVLGRGGWLRGRGGRGLVLGGAKQEVAGCHFLDFVSEWLVVVVGLEYC
jgi:hypothetical protein